MMEVELKLLVDEDGAQALLRHPLLQQYASAPPRQQQQSSTYFDTPDLQVRRSDAGLRVRQIDGERWIQTFKGGGEVNGGLHSRHEWESRVAGPEPDLPALRSLVDTHGAWGKLLCSPALKRQLSPLFSTHVTRTIWDLRLPQGDEVECVLDQGNLERNNDQVPISEIELELKSGDPVHLFDFALALSADIPMHIGSLSKADRGYAMISPQPDRAVKATPLTLSRRMTIEKAFQAIAANCMAHIQANEAGVAHGHDVESLHQMRVGLRRLRSALGLFGDVLQPSPPLQEELDWLATQLGAARDWDVLAGSTLPALADAAPHQLRIASVKLAALQQAHDRHQDVAAAVRSPRYVHFILSFTRWLQACAWRDGMRAQERERLEKRLPSFAQAKLRQNRRRLLKRGDALRGATPDARHRVRIAAKKMRYATEFFQSLYRAKTVRPFVKALSRMQDELGWLNDVAVADGLLKQMQEQQTEVAGRASFIRGFMLAHVQNEDRKIRRLWKKFVPMKLPG